MEIRKPEQLQDVSYLIIPGGESTTMAKLAEYHNLVILSVPLTHSHMYMHVKWVNFIQFRFGGVQFYPALPNFCFFQ